MTPILSRGHRHSTSIGTVVGVLRHAAMIFAPFEASFLTECTCHTGAAANPGCRRAVVRAEAGTACGCLWLLFSLRKCDGIIILQGAVSLPETMMGPVHDARGPTDIASRCAPSPTGRVN
jgi:hypothetical protein